ncbi:MAG: acetyl-CoA carboxylase, biotin carboxyl carrier protein [Planctomycetes bacterium GWF2_42_9]|nr:MAG: acetyl-CoA carboxylase, biotin carboxyl carrier protein [Planctomycetes bacterium GWF2_42_9]
MSDEKKNDLKKVKELIELMVEKDLVEVEIVDGDSKIHLKRPNLSMPITAPMPMMMQAAHPGVSAPAASAPAQAAAPVDDKLADIKSPIIGTFYASPSPDSPPYVKVGDHVTADTVVCILEAMKVMNEIKAETTGTIEKVLINNGQTVEYGQVLFKVRPD